MGCGFSGKLRRIWKLRNGDCGLFNERSGSCREVTGFGERAERSGKTKRCRNGVRSGPERYRAEASKIPHYVSYLFRSMGRLILYRPQHVRADHGLNFENRCRLTFAPIPRESSTLGSRRGAPASRDQPSQAL